LLSNIRDLREIRGLLHLADDLRIMKNEPENLPNRAAYDSLDELLSQAQWPDDASDPLDRLLHSAQWPQPTGGLPIDVRRIEKRTSWKRALIAVGATAAAVLLAVLAIESARKMANWPSANGTNIVAGDDPKITLPPREVRMRQILEQVRERPAPEDVAIDHIIARRIADPDGNLEELVQPLMARQAVFERRMLARFSTFLGERETAAVELLGWLGSETSLPLLRHERYKPSAHVAAVRALIQLADDRMLARLERQEWDADLREEIAAELRSRNDRQIETSTLFKGDQSCIETGSDSWPQADLF
jgi:hypothetical protein